MKATPGKGIAVEIGSPPSFSGAKKLGQAAQDVEAISRGLVLEGPGQGAIQATERFEARGLPVVGGGGNVPGSSRVQLYRNGKPVPIQKTPPPGGEGSGGKVGVGGAVVTGIAIGATLSGPGSTSEKMKALATSYLLNEAAQAITTKAIGPALADTVSFGVGHALMLCDRSMCEDQARREALADLNDEIEGRTRRIFVEETWRGWDGARDRAIREMYKERGLYNEDEALRAANYRISGIGVCEKPLPASPSPSLISNDNGPRMYSR